jgi:hypothetical protein
MKADFGDLMSKVPGHYPMLEPTAELDHMVAEDGCGADGKALPAKNESPILPK